MKGRLLLLPPRKCACVTTVYERCLVIYSPQNFNETQNVYTPHRYIPLFERRKVLVSLLTRTLESDDARPVNV